MRYAFFTNIINFLLYKVQNVIKIALNLFTALIIINILIGS